MNEQQRITDERFDDVARDAGAALRHPAPVDGIRSVRAARRRQQQIRAAIGGAALVAIVVVGAAVVLRDDPGATVMVQPDDGTPGTTVATVPNSTFPSSAPTTVPPLTAPVTAPVSAPATAPATTPVEPVAGLSAAAAAWRDARHADGFTVVDVVQGQGTTARLLTAQRPDPQAFASAVLLDDGRVIEPPAEIAATFNALHAVGGAPAIVEVAYDGSLVTKTQVWIIDPRSGEWVATGDLGFTPTDSGWGGITVRSVGDTLLVADNSYVRNGDGSLSLSPDQRGVVVHGDLSITEMAPAPDGVALFFTSTSGGKALQLYGPAVEGGISLDVSYDQPWQYDPTANEWTEIPLPAWMDCSGLELGCQWAIVPDIGATELEVPTEHGVVALVPDGTVGLYDAASSAWTRLDDAPFTLTMPTTAVAGDRVVVAPWRSGLNDFSQIGVLDLTTGTWTTNQVDIPAGIEARFDTEWTDVSWDLRTAGSRVMAVPGRSFQQSTAAPIAVYDVATGTWSTPTEADLANWALLTTRFTA